MSESITRGISFSSEMVRAILDGKKVRRRLYVRKGEDCNSPEHIARRLANSVQVNAATNCWEWQRATNGIGYGTLTINGRRKYAHRLAYELGVAPIPEGMLVLHKCDNPSCINPEHLEAGTQSQNMRDCHKRGRSRIPSPRLHGEDNGSCKLTDTQVDEIRRRLNAGDRQQAIADCYGVSQGQISNIKRGVQR